MAPSEHRCVGWCIRWSYLQIRIKAVKSERVISSAEPIGKPRARGGVRGGRSRQEPYSIAACGGERLRADRGPMIGLDGL
jgi:hypothetical protein